MKTKCPVCNCEDTRPDFDYPETMTVCKKCGSEWNNEGDITLDTRNFFSEEENESLGRNPRYQCGSCEKTFFNLTKDNECPHCESGNWVEGSIDE